MQLAGVAGLVAGALSMAAGEYISVASQKDVEEADIEKERQEQQKGPMARLREFEELVSWSPCSIFIHHATGSDLTPRVRVTRVYVCVLWSPSPLSVQADLGQDQQLLAFVFGLERCESGQGFSRQSESQCYHQHSCSLIYTTIAQQRNLPLLPP